MNNPKISVVVPVYNTENYLRECLDCFLKQAYKNIEVILVDDGSTDNSGSILDEYANKEDYFRVIHQSNQGVSAARNAALEIATGDYIGFVDSDDSFMPGMFEEFISIADKTDADIIQSIGFLCNNKPQIHNSSIYEFNNDEARDEFFTIGKIRPSLWLGIIKRELISDVRFPSHIHHWEDYAFIAVMVSRANKVVVTSNCYYLYRIREGSATQVPLNDKQISCLHIYDYLAENGVYKTQQERDDVRSMFICGVFKPYVLVSPVKKYKQLIRKNIRQYIGSIYRSRSIYFKRKIMMTLFLISEKLTISLSKRYHAYVLRHNSI